MTTPPATPRPWTHHAGHIDADRDGAGEAIVYADKPADRALIVRAVNAHDDLVAALTRLSNAVQTMIEADPYNDAPAEATVEVHRAYEQALAAVEAAGEAK